MYASILHQCLEPKKLPISDSDIQPSTFPSQHKDWHSFFPELSQSYETISDDSFQEECAIELQGVEEETVISFQPKSPNSQSLRYIKLVILILYNINHSKLILADVDRELNNKKDLLNKTVYDLNDNIVVKKNENLIFEEDCNLRKVIQVI